MMTIGKRLLDLTATELMSIDVVTIPERMSLRAAAQSPVVTALPHASIGELARTMLDAHIHRVVSVDAQGRPIGVVSSTDVLAAVAAEDRRDARLSLE